MIIFNNSEHATRNSRLLAQGKIKPIAEGVYITAGVKNEAEAIRDNLINILSYLKVEGIISYSSGLSAHTSEMHSPLWIVGSRERQIKIGDFEVNVLKGNDKEKNSYGVDIIEGTKIAMPSFYRALLQNFSTRKVDVKKIDKDAAIKKLFSLLSTKGGEYNWESFEEKLKIFAQKLNYMDEFNEIKSALEDYRQKKNLSSLDSVRVHMFDSLLERLQMQDSPGLKIFEKTTNSIENIAFIESYFSNYIEGTEFEVREAYAIVYNKEHKYQRHKDGHDVTRTYELIKENIENPINFTSARQYIDQLKNWHAKMLAHRSADILVGQFKTMVNKAGSTVFVAPEKVEAMLKYSFDLSQELTDPIKKALFLKTAFTEIHPFEDGNGRMSRLVMNNFLSLHNFKRVIIPTVYRDDYITALKAFSKNNNVKAITQTLNKACLITNEIDYNLSINQLLEWLYSKSAFEDPGVSMWGLVPDKDFELGGGSQLDLFSNLPVISKKYK